MGNTMQDEVFMKKAIELSKLAVEHGNEPFGAVLVKDGKAVFCNENQIYTKHDPTFDPGILRTDRHYGSARIYALFQLRTMFHVQWRNGLGKIGKTGLWCEQYGLGTYPWQCRV